MQAGGASGLDLQTQLAHKEREQKEPQAVRVHKLECSLQKAQEECSSLREHYQQLKEDFQFNLAILDERDRELNKYDVITARALTLENERQEALNNLYMQVTRLEEQRAREAEEMQVELSESRHNVAQHRLQLDKLNRSTAIEIQKQTEENERMKSNLQRRIQEVEGQMALQKQELTVAFEAELRQQEHEFNLKMDEMCAAVLSHNLKVKLLSRETEEHCHAQLQATNTLKASEEFCQQIQTQLQHKDQQIKGLTVVKDHRIKELEDEVKRMQSRLKKTEGYNINKYENVVEALKKCEAQLETQHQAHTEQLQKAEKRIDRIQENVDVLTARVRCLQKDKQEAMEQKKETIVRLQQEVETTRTGWDKYITQVSREMVVKDSEMISLQDGESKLRAELERSREEIERYKQQLCAGLERERNLEQREVQVELEWQRHCEDMKAKLYLANEKLIQELSQARDQGLTPKVDSLPSVEIQRMQEQNTILRDVVTQMRKNMEHLSHPLVHSQVQPQVSSPRPVPHPGSTAIPSKVSPTGGQQEDRVAHTECALAKIMEKIALAQQLQEENLHLRRQQAPDLFENVLGAKGNPPLLRTRLKQAASCIARLSREKQQLIEMGNRIRAQITTAGLQEPVEAERDSSTEKQADQLGRFSALEQLQYQLTTQELQFALRQRVCTDVEQLLPETNTQGPATAYPRSQDHKTTDRSESSRNKENTAPLSQSQSSSDMGPQPHSGLSRSQCSTEESLHSLKELWEILDREISPSIFSEGNSELSRREVAESLGAEVQMMVDGISAPICEAQQRMNPGKTSSNTTRTRRHGAPGKIRNYNVKD
ncbi:coiled-coil domain-containing protein 57 isoform X2 [Scophthalmus maximus]|uniref:coiled-coil domain-containing protein 57 isoform X2 n=1 Tax=Scophthalmus maximus TaxID=52904 RepID=UPI001FA8261A|nr:coiled-coil domain-containing protein 57 isoform X2 [Scophthalmus maximus]